MPYNMPPDLTTLEGCHAFINQLNRKLLASQQELDAALAKICDQCTQLHPDDRPCLICQIQTKKDRLP